jgi:hypothetical protein
LAETATLLTSADYVDATSQEIFGLDFVSIIPLEEVSLGSLVSF